MEQIHRRDNNRIRRKFFLAGLICVFGLLVLLVPSVREVSSRLVYMAAPGVWEWGDGLANNMRLFSAMLYEKQDLLLKNRELQDDVARLEVLVLDRNLLEERVLALEESLGRKGTENRILAKVFGGSGRIPYDAFLIDIGKDQNISKGDIVVYAGSVVVGEISEVYDRSAKVVPYSSPGSTHLVFVGPKEIPGTSMGRGMGNFEVKIPRDSFVMEQDHVFLPPVVAGQEKLILGVVGFVEKKQEDSFERVLFRAPFNTTAIQTVEVLRFGK